MNTFPTLVRHVLKVVGPIGLAVIVLAFLLWIVHSVDLILNIA